MGPELRHLRYFVAVAEELSFTRAARRLHISQPALSAQIAELERIVGVQLLRRTTRKVELTRPGQTFLEHAHRVLDASDDLGSAMRTASAVRDVLTVSVSLDTAPYVAEPLEAFRADHPEIELVTTPAGDASTPELLVSGHVDAGIVWTGAADGDARLRSWNIFAVTLLVAVRVDDPLACLDQIPITVLAERPLVMFQRPLGPAIWEVLVRQLRPGVSSAPIHEVVSDASPQQAMLRAVAAGAGVAPITHAHVDALGLPDVVARPTDPALQAGLELVTLTRPPAVVKTLANFLTARHAAMRSNADP